MGFVDNMLQTMSTKVVSSINTEDKSGMLSMENGDNASGPAAPKYKRRRVSAVRDFPPGCGPSTPPILASRDFPTGCGPCAPPISRKDVRTDENSEKSGDGKVDGCLGKINHLETTGEGPPGFSDQVNGHESVKVEPAGLLLPEALNREVVIKSAEAVEDKLVEALEHATLGQLQEQGKVDDVVIKPVDPCQQQGKAPEALNREVVIKPAEACGVKPVESLEDATVDILQEQDKGEVVVPLEQTVQRKYPPRRRISAVRDFPPFCGRNASSLSKDGGAKFIDYLEKRSMGPENPGTVERLVKEVVKADAKQMENVVKDGDAKNRRAESVSRMTEDKLRAELEGLASKEGRNQHQFGDSSSNEMKVCEENMHQRTVKSPRESQLNQKSKIAVKSGDREIGGPGEILGRKFSVHIEDKSKRKLSCNSGGKNLMLEKDLELSSGREVALGIMAREKCPWKQGELVQKPNNSGGKNLMLEKDLELSSGREVALGIMARGKCPWKQGELVQKPNKLVADVRGRKNLKNDFILLERPKSGFKTEKNEIDNSRGVMKKNSSPTGKAKEDMGQMIDCSIEDDLEDGLDDFRLVARSNNFDVTLPPSCPNSSSSKVNDGNYVNGMRNKVREVLRLFQVIYRKLLQEDEGKSKEERGSARKRFDLQASKILKEKGKYVNVGKQIFGSVPGVEVGDEFHYRVELNIIGLHRQIQGGIDYVKQDGRILATSIVSSGAYDDDIDDSDVLIYTGSGGNMMHQDKEPEDQKLERGNLALKNSAFAKNPVRVICGDTKVSDSSDAKGRTYIYDGLYLVEKYWQEIGPHGKLVFKFKLVRIPGQPELSWKVVKKSKKLKVREGLRVDDISQGEEKIPICAVNTIDDEKPPRFKYTTHMIYPTWYRPLSPKGCGCTNGCSRSLKCSCMEKNGGDIPYNHNGAIVEAKPLVYECGPSCRCPPSCYNRVTQHGINFQLEIFKTESRGWGVRSLNSIPSGSFICEYAGELLEDKEAEQKTDSDEYLFDIGNQWNDHSIRDGLTNLIPEAQSSADEEGTSGGFTIDAARFGNVGRFINHSCSPNLYAQNVLYDHEDKRIPHVMLFAVDNIPPLQELTYHYNYMIDEVFDSNGNVKKKSCYCGSLECTGRMY